MVGVVVVVAVVVAVVVVVLVAVVVAVVEGVVVAVLVVVVVVVVVTCVVVVVVVVDVVVMGVVGCVHPWKPPSSNTSVMSFKVCSTVSHATRLLVSTWPTQLNAATPPRGVRLYLLICHNNVIEQRLR